MIDSIRHYKTKEIKDLVERMDDETLTIAEAFATLRETVKLPKTWKQMIIKQLKDEPKLILEFIKTSRSVMPAESKFKLPYKRAYREEELIQTLVENYQINVEKAKAKIVFNSWRDPHAKDPDLAQEFNYCVEAAIAPRTDIGQESAGDIEIIGQLNGTISPDGSNGESYFSSNNDVYQWHDKHGDYQTSSSVREILQTCGFSKHMYAAKRRVPSVLYINLSTPCAEYLGGAGKTAIDLTPYAKDIAEVVKNLAYKMLTYHNTGVGVLGWDFDGGGEGRQYSAKEYLEDFLRDRFDAINDNPSLLYEDPLNQSSVWYRIRPKMIDGGYEPRKTWGEVRKHITSIIDKTCKELFGKEREDLGIVAKAKGMMFYNRSVYPVDYKSFEALGAKGVFILVIEKEDIANKFKDFAVDSGIALVHTGGKFTKDVKRLIDNATTPIATLTDYDYYGVKMSEETVRPTHRIGINKDIVEWLQQHGHPEITLEDVQEEYTPSIIPEDEYLQKYRIELDSITALFPDTPGEAVRLLWEYAEYKINELRKIEGFDYSNVISKADIPGPASIKSLVSKVEKYVEDLTEKDWEILEEQLVGIKKLDSIDDIEKEHNDALTEIVEEDEQLQEIADKVEEFNEELDELLD